MEYPIVTPDFLEAEGFHLFTGNNQDEWETFPASFDVEFSGDEICYLEKEFARNMFCIVLELWNYNDGSNTHRFQLYIQENVGMGFVPIPCIISELTEYHFKLIYEGIRQDGKYNPVFF